MNKKLLSNENRCDTVEMLKPANSINCIILVIKRKLVTNLREQVDFVVGAEVCDATEGD